MVMLVHLNFKWNVFDSNPAYYPCVTVKIGADASSTRASHYTWHHTDTSDVKETGKYTVYMTVWASQSDVPLYSTISLTNQKLERRSRDPLNQVPGYNTLHSNSHSRYRGRSS